MASLQLADAGGLVLGLQLGTDFVDAGLSCDGLCGSMVVAREHDDVLDSERTKRLDGRASVITEVVANRENGPGGPMLAHEHDRLPFFL